MALQRSQQVKLRRLHAHRRRLAGHQAVVNQSIAILSPYWTTHKPLWVRAHFAPFSLGVVITQVESTLYWVVTPLLRGWAEYTAQRVPDAAVRRQTATWILAASGWGGLMVLEQTIHCVTTEGWHWMLQIGASGSVRRPVHPSCYGLAPAIGHTYRATLSVLHLWLGLWSLLLARLSPVLNVHRRLLRTITALQRALELCIVLAIIWWIAHDVQWVQDLRVAISWVGHQSVAEGRSLLGSSPLICLLMSHSAALLLGACYARTLTRFTARTLALFQTTVRKAWILHTDRPQLLVVGALLFWMVAGLCSALHRLSMWDTDQLPRDPSGLDLALRYWRLLWTLQGGMGRLTLL